MKLSKTILGAGALAALSLSGHAQDHKTIAPVLPKEPELQGARAQGQDAADASSTTKPGGATLAQRFHPLEKGVVHGSEADGQLSAASRRWKASFDAQGATFVPFLGSHQPRNQPLRLRFESLSAGGIELASAAEAARRAGDRIRIERGAVEEAWQLSEEGAEQLFILRQRPVPGEIVVRVGFEGDYSPVLDEAGVLFRGELGSVRYGLAFAFDAAGRRTDVAQELEGDSILLRVPADFVASARFPLTIDPLVETYCVECSMQEAVIPDIAFEDAGGDYIFVYEYAFSQTDHDVYSVLGTDAGIIPGTLGIVDSSIRDWRRPRVASNLQETNFLVVAETGPTGARHVRGRVVEGILGWPGPEILFSGDVIGDQFHPDVGGDPNGVGSYCLVWERGLSATDHDILARLVVPWSGEAGPVIYLENSGGTRDEMPAISSSCGKGTGETPHWTVVWQRQFSANDRDIYGAQIARDGSIRTPTFLIDYSANDDSEPSVSTIAAGTTPDRPYVVAYTRRAGPSNGDVHLVSLVGNQVLAATNLSSGLPSSNLDESQPVVDTDGHLFAVAYRKTLPNADTDIWLNWVYAAGSELTRFGDTEVLASTILREANPAIFSKYSGGRNSRRFGTAHDVDYITESDIRATIVDAPESAPVISYCRGASACPCGPNAGMGGCPNSVSAAGALLSHAGIPNVSTDTLLLIASGMPANQTCLFLQGQNLINGGNGIVFGDGLRCVGGSLVRLATRTASGGSYGYPAAGDERISQRGDVPALGGTRYYQVWYRDPASSCSGERFNLTNALRVTWLP